ncbi:MAG: hypothetical protein GWN99_19780 [Gemmatimonadetes bacterium]|uniref:Spondin domain-containing protein n=1 Tax=Candidatus Kutchimonas denitrificans TaxID=3056748 RepID=A0AAE4ZC78_9BACT|nr:hypothetical protein [Gemmatimonadota bacterium]NIR76446.1 hypothetical protein [Candidatus Kutchimonas denitrificans]NIS03264.1 hypothetical protein [Gemmatimonadota bacterium]NIT69125.1 hypothetical protein [Gemmatimonadota bacterium]NIU54517.1 hypothetical protein [Gemmatimonadota bacterium]
MQKMVRLIVGLAVVPVMAGCGESGELTGTDPATYGVEADVDKGFGPAGSATYEVTIYNLTSGQPLTPPLASVHRKPVSLFTVGDPASFELKEIAENGNLGPMVGRLDGDKHVNDVVVAVSPGPPPLLPGASISFEVEAERGAKYLSIVSMLICTNDGFTGIDGVRLPRDVGASVTMYTDGYDAGTEVNTEDFADLVPPCPVLTGVSSTDPGTGTSNPALAEGGVIRHHPGIQGGADLVPGIHGWSDPVAKIEIERVQ